VGKSLTSQVRGPSPEPPFQPLNTLKACWKLARALLHILAGLLTILLVFPRLSQEKKEIRIQAWSIEMLGCLGIKLVVTGQPAALAPCCWWPITISWLDINLAACGALLPFRLQGRCPALAGDRRIGRWRRHAVH